MVVSGRGANHVLKMSDLFFKCQYDKKRCLKTLPETSEC